MKQIDEEKFIYQLEQVYLEIARSVPEASMVKLYKQPGDADDPIKDANITFGAAAVSIAFSFAAIEGFCNAQLYHKYASIKPESRESGWKPGNREKKFDYIYKDEDSLNAFIKSATIQDKLKALSSACDIESIHTDEPDLWNDINQISRDMRDFIIHPKPEPDEFQAKMDAIMTRHKMNKYYQIAEKIIRYFYVGTGTKIPDWLKENTLLRFLNSSDLRKKRPRPKIESMEKELDDLNKAVFSIYHRLDMYEKYREVVKANKRLKKMDQIMLKSINDAFADQLVMSIGRLCDKDSRTRSLVQYLENLKVCQEYTTRERHMKLYDNSKGMVDIGKRTFDNLAGENEEKYSPEMIDVDIGLLTESDPCKKIRAYRDQYIAHDDRDKRVPIPTYSELIEAFDVIKAAVQKCNLLIRSAAIPELKPMYQGDWAEVFTIPWIDENSSPDI